MKAKAKKSKAKKSKSIESIGIILFFVTLATMVFILYITH